MLKVRLRLLPCGMLIDDHHRIITSYRSTCAWAFLFGDLLNATHYKSSIVINYTKI